MVIDVIQDDIDQGVKSSCYICPVALATARYLKNEVEIGQDSIYCEGKNYKMTKNCQRFISRFDNSEMVHPFHFRLMEIS